MKSKPIRSTSRRAKVVLSTALVVCAVATVTPTAATAVTAGPTTARDGLSAGADAGAGVGADAGVDLGAGVERISVATDEGYGAASITPDGRSVVFTSLKNGPPQGGNEVYVRDRRTGLTRTVPLIESWTPAISGDGRQVAATAPAQGMTAQRMQQHSLDLGTLPVSCHRCNEPSLSSDGRYLAYGGLAQPGQRRQVVVADREGGSVSVSLANNSAPARPSLSGDGRYLAYQNLEKADVYLWDRTTGTTSAPVDGPSRSASLVQLSDDGRKVVYLSGSDTYVHDVGSGTAQLVPNVTGVAIDPTGRYLLYTPNGTGGPSLVLRDLRTGTDETVSDQPATAETDSVSADGRDVVFQSAADGIVPGDTNGTSDVFVRRFF
ncbi:TolB family protein [Streptomyces sp. NPDC088557]|uniref:TolB family protein n=1 Tax=Streptomyces sp. NPDC088557 TaxID=3365867 RepID=UPI00381C245A